MAKDALRIAGDDLNHGSDFMHLSQDIAVVVHMRLLEAGPFLSCALSFDFDFGRRSPRVIRMWERDCGTMVCINVIILAELKAIACLSRSKLSEQQKCYYAGLDDVSSASVLPLATGMALTCSLLSLKRVRPPSARYVIWPRYCFSLTSLCSHN